MALTSNVKVPPNGAWINIANIASGGSGGLIKTGASFSQNSGTYSYSAMSSMEDITIQRAGKNPIKVAETLEMILKRLLIVEADFQKMEKYPALKEAYDNYKLIETLVSGEDNTDAV